MQGQQGRNKQSLRFPLSQGFFPIPRQEQSSSEREQFQLSVKTDELVEIDDVKRPSSQFKSDDILNIFNSLKAHSYKRFSKVGKSNPSKGKVGVYRQPSRKIEFTHLSDKVRLNIQRRTKSLKVAYRFEFNDTQTNKLRFQSQVQIFQYLWYGVEELKILDEGQLTQEELKLVRSGEDQISSYIRLIISNIDQTFLEMLNKNSKSSASREYQNKWNYIISNIKDQSNPELRRRILNKSFTPKEMAEAKQIQFYTSAKRQKWILKERQYIAEFTVNDELKQESETEITDIHPLTYNDTHTPEDIHTVLQPTQTPCDHFSWENLLLLRDFVNGKHTEKMRSRLHQSLKGQTQTRLVNNLLQENTE